MFAITSVLRILTCLNIFIISALLTSCGGSSGNDNNSTNNETPVNPENPAPVIPQTPSTTSYCDQFIDQTKSFFCADFEGTSPKSLIGKIPPMSFRDQTFREYSKGEVFDLPDPTPENINTSVINLHTDIVDDLDFSAYAAKTEEASKNWDITAHSRDGYVGM